MQNELVWGSSRRFSLEIQQTIIFTICVMNLEAFQRTPIFFQVDGIDCLEQTKSSHVGKKIHEMTKMWVFQWTHKCLKPQDWAHACFSCFWSPWNAQCRTWAQSNGLDSLAIEISSRHLTTYRHHGLKVVGWLPKNSSVAIE